jgi:hypothetical protein
MIWLPLAGLGRVDRGGARFPRLCRTTGEELSDWRDAASVDEAEPAEDQHNRCGNECRDRGDVGDRANGSEGVGVEQQAAQRLAFEYRGDGAGELGFAWLGEGSALSWV